MADPTDNGINNANDEIDEVDPSLADTSNEAEIGVDEEDVETDSDSTEGIEEEVIDPIVLLNQRMQSLDQNFESMSVGVTRRFDRSQKEIMAINKLLVTGGSALAALLLAATALSFFNWSSNSTFDDLSGKMAERIDSFSSLDRQLARLREDVELANDSNAQLEGEILGFKGSLDIAMEQVRIRYEAQKSDVDEQIDVLGGEFEDFVEKFSALAETNNSISLELRRVIQATQRLQGFEGVLNALVTLEKNKYYDAISSLQETEATENTEGFDNDMIDEMVDDGYIYFDRDKNSN
ncbi:hypothetical protein OAX09_03065 [Gammaproteobacteria bacterium]|jgi:hypothetical protein|nr:hypothetical protein [Gammaproteobacteria bacterium]